MNKNEKSIWHNLKDSKWRHIQTTDEPLLEDIQEQCRKCNHLVYHSMKIGRHNLGSILCKRHLEGTGVFNDPLTFCECCKEDEE